MQLPLKKEKNDQEEIDHDFIDLISPEGGVSFNDEKFIKQGDGYVAIYRLHSYPGQVNLHWLAKIMNQNDIVVTLDIKTENKDETIENINRSYQEQDSRYNEATKLSVARQAKTRMNELEELLHEIEGMHDVLKNIVIRFYFSSLTKDQLEIKIGKVTKELTSAGYRLVCDINESKEHYKALTQSASKQIINNSFISRKGQPISSSALAKGLPFHFSSLNDDKGLFLGFTDTNGTVMFDQWKIDQFRLSYDLLIAGVKGSGKSTTLKKLAMMNFMTGNRVRIFDFMNDFTYLAKVLGGHIIYMDGSRTKINPLEITRVPGIEGHLDNNIFLRNQLNKAGVWLNYLAPHLDQEMVLEFQSSLKKFYEYKGFYDRKQIVGLDPEEYPTLSQYLSFAKEYKFQVQEEGENIDVLDKLLKNIENLIEQYGEMIDCHTSIQNISIHQFLVFNMASIKNLSSNVLDAQFYLAFTLCVDDATFIGSQMKDLYDTKQIAFEDITRSLIIIDEAHRIINTNKESAIDQILSFAREERHVFTGLALATQSIRDMIKKNSSKEASEKITTLFDLIQYKLIMRQDENAVDIIRESFGSQLTEQVTQNIPKYRKGHCALIVDPTNSLEMQIRISKHEESIFRGGA